jgi:hypothetical protein
VRFAVDAYINFARTRPWQEAVTSSLTELFAPEIHQKRLDTWPEHYPWIDKEGYFYFRKRLTEARRDVQFALNFTLDHYRTREQQERARCSAVQAGRAASSPDAGQPVLGPPPAGSPKRAAPGRPPRLRSSCTAVPFPMGTGAEALCCCTPRAGQLRAAPARS